MEGFERAGDTSETTVYGTALQILGNAAEHLVSHRVYREGPISEVESHEAIRILLRRSREIFEEYAARQGMKKAA